MTTTSPFIGSIEEAIAAAQQGMHQAEVSASYSWLQEAARAVKQVAMTHFEFSADDVMEEIAEEFRQDEMRALGPVIKRMANGGICVPTDRFVPSRRKSRHGAPIRLWTSLVYPSA